LTVAHAERDDVVDALVARVGQAVGAGARAVVRVVESHQEREHRADEHLVALRRVVPQAEQLVGQRPDLAVDREVVERDQEGLHGLVLRERHRERRPGVARLVDDVGGGPVLLLERVAEQYLGLVVVEGVGRDRGRGRHHDANGEQAQSDDE
jgi:hypothetical protein